MTAVDKLNGSLKKSFTDALYEVFSENSIVVNGTRDETTFKPMQIISVIGITGDLQGSIFLGCNRDEGIGLGTELFRAQGLAADPAGADSLMRSTMAEFSNQIAGRAIMYLQNHETDCNMTPPTVFTGYSIHSELCQAVLRFTVSIQGAFGEAHLHVEVKNMKKKDKNS